LQQNFLNILLDFIALFGRIERMYKSTKFYRIYGISATAMARKLNLSISTLRRYLQDPKKKKVMLKLLSIKEKKDIFE